MDEPTIRDDAGRAAPAAYARPRLWRRAASLLLRRVPGLATARLVLLPGSFRPLAGSGTRLTPQRLRASLSRATRQLAVDRLRRLPCFHPATYRHENADVAATGADPYLHALFHGSFEGRKLFRPETLARGLALSPPPVVAQPRPPAGPAHAALYVSSLGNVFMREIAEDIAFCLRAGGATAEVRDEHAPIAQRPPFSVFVAPHEFFLLGRGVDWVRDEIIAGGIMLNTEQPQTSWFGQSLPFLLASRGVIELCPQSAALLATTGTPSLHLTPAPPSAGQDIAEDDRQHPLFRVLPLAARATPSAATPFAARPIDVAFFGTESDRREDLLARLAGGLADFECVIHYRRGLRGPIRHGTPDSALTRLARHIAGHTKIALNLHRDAFGYLEWHRIVRQGIAAGAVVVSEPCLPHPLLTPGVHYLEASGRQLTELIAWLLRSEDGRRAAATVQANGQHLLGQILTPQHAATQLLGFLHTHAQPARP